VCGTQVFSRLHLATDARAYRSEHTTPLFLLALCRWRLWMDTPRNSGTWPQPEGEAGTVDWPLAAAAAVSWMRAHVDETHAVWVGVASAVLHAQTAVALQCAGWLLGDAAAAVLGTRMHSAFVVRRTHAGLRSG
jgi:hypothetical protein